MALSGTINASISFLDSASSSGVESEKKLSLSSADVYTTGQVVVVTGTVGTSAISVDISATGFRNAAGNEVTLSLVNHAGLVATATTFAEFGGDAVKLCSNSNDLAISCVDNEAGPVSVYTSEGTATFSLLLLGE